MSGTVNNQQEGWSLQSYAVTAFLQTQLSSLQQWPLHSIIATSTCLFIILLSIVLTLRHRKLLRIILKTFRRDLSGIVAFIRMNRELRLYERAGDSVGRAFERTVVRHPNKVCFQFEDQAWTFEEVKSMSNKIAGYFYGEGYRRGDVVALFMENRPEYVCIWLGLSKIGVVTSLINSNLRHHPLRHSIQVSNTKAVIFGAELAQALEEALFEDESSSIPFPLFSMGTMKTDENAEQEMAVASTCGPLGTRSQSLRECLQLQQQLDSSDPQVVENEPDFQDNLSYIFTSGTTGLPKPTITKHSRFLLWSVAYQNLSHLKCDDVVYTCLPLYHGSGGIVAVGRALVYGNTVVLRKRFSASTFWQDCVLHRVTVVQHIGEICRYLLRQGYRPEEKQHRVRIMTGAGLRVEIWPEFVSRFGIKEIHELYGSTDGNCNMGNFDGRVGAVGFVPVLLRRMYPIGLIRVDLVTGEPLRNPKSGLAIRCEPGEAGELVGRIIENIVIREFPGYAGKSGGIENKKKILHNVFRQGDSHFRTGDLFVQDDHGYLYFKDRLGDTFRWKGENVSTAEVEGVIGSVTGFKDCVVYGVQVPGTEGRAGTAAIADPGKSLDLQQLAAAIKTNLPSYARPLFVRLLDQLETTGTHRLRKTDLQKEGFCRESIRDPLFFYEGGKYVELTADLYKGIMEGAVRL